MAFCCIFGVIFVIFVGSVCGSDVTEGSPVIKDRIRTIQTNISEEQVSNAINEFIAYGPEKMVVLRNQAQHPFRVYCQSRDEESEMVYVAPGNSQIFTFRPKKDGSSVFWCTVGYELIFSRFDVYNQRVPHMCPSEHEHVYQYTVRHDGIYADGLKGSEGTKIRALFKGHNKFTLWESFEDNVTDGFLVSGLVDGGMCSDLPDYADDVAAAVTLCYHHCVHLYEHLGCSGKQQTVQADDKCIDVKINADILGKLSAIKGC